ncbi:hypothetical protein [Rhodovibrio salinarum]|nr:hypothetical protein [Rhodovibrio salinarum]
MRAFITAVAALLVLSVGAGAIMTAANPTTTQEYATDNVRLGD